MMARTWLRVPSLVGRKCLDNRSRWIRSNRVTVLQILQCTNLGGMEQVAYRLMEELSSSNDTEFRIMTPRPFGPGEQRLRAIDSQVSDSTYRGRFGWRDARSFKQEVADRAEMCTHVWVTGTSVAALRAVRDLRQPKVLSHHYHHFEQRFSAARWRAFYEGFGRNVDVITYPTRFTRDEAVRIAPWVASRAVVVPNGSSCTWKDEADRNALQRAARRRLGVPEESFVVGNAAWLTERKRFDVFLTTAKQILNRIPETRFVVCGGGPLEAQLRAQARSLGIEASVTFTGWVEDLSDYYQSWDVMLFNSDYDTLPCGPLEASAHGCVVVASLRYGGLSEFIHHDVNGFLLNDHDVNRLAEIVCGLAVDRGLAERCRSASRNLLEGEFSVAAGAAFYREFFATSDKGASGRV